MVRFATALTASVLLAFGACLPPIGAATAQAAAPDDVVGPGDHVLGTSSSPTLSAAKANALRTVALNALKPSITRTDAQFASGGVGLRNQTTGAMTVSGVKTPVKLALLYWAVIDNGPAKPSEAVVKLTHVLAAGNETVSVKGKMIGQGDSPCWGGTGIVVYRASVPVSFAKANGTYEIALTPGSFGAATGGDPWVGETKYPAWEGASLVLIGTGTSTVSIFDEGLAGSTFLGSLTYLVNLASTPAGQVLFTNIGADGQQGKSLTPMPGYRETTYINGKKIAGPGSPIGDSDWNGSAGLPLPQLWDDTGHNITAAAKGASGWNIVITQPSGNTQDCLTPVANLVQY